MNVLFITADQWRGECLSCLGHLVQTPNLDKLAAQGVHFSKHFAQATPCSPSRASIHTGMYQMNHRVCTNGSPLSERFTNMALEARAHGYNPQLFGYTDTALDPNSATTTDKDTQTYETPLPGYEVTQALTEKPLPWMQWLREKGYQVPSEHDFMALYRPASSGPEYGASYGAAPYGREHTETAFLREKLEQYISAQGDAPWFAHLSWLRPHPPFIAPAPYNTMYDPADVAPPIRHSSLTQQRAEHPYLDYVLSQKLSAPSSYNVADGRGLKPDMSELDLRQMRATYYGMMSEVDHQLGLLLAFLDERKLTDNTLIIFSSDHGEQLGDHYLLDKQGFYDQSYHIPLIIRPPGRAWDSCRGRRVEQFTQNIDLMPTVLDFIGTAQPRQCDGHSLKAFMQAQTPSNWRTEVYWEHDFRDILTGAPEQRFGLNLEECSLAVVRDHKYKYVHFNRLPALLFDLEHDPHELHNLISHPEHTGTALHYAQKMLDWRLRNAERSLSHWHYSESGPHRASPERNRTYKR